MDERDLDLNLWPASHDEAANQPSNSEALPLAPAAARPPDERGQAHRQRGRPSGSQDSDSRAHKQRKISNEAHPMNLKMNEPLHSSSGGQQPKHEVHGVGLNNMEGHTPQSICTPPQPSGSGAPRAAQPPAQTLAVPSRATVPMTFIAFGPGTVDISFENTETSTAFSFRPRRDANGQIDDK